MISVLTRFGSCSIRECIIYTGDIVKAWLSMKDEDREQAQFKEPTLKVLLQALQDIGCSDVMAQIQAEARGGGTKHGTLEDSEKDDPNVTKGAASAKVIVRWPIGVPRLSSSIASTTQELESGKNLKMHVFTIMYMMGNV